MIKSIIVISIVFFTFSTSLESYAQEPDVTKSISAGHVAVSAGSGQSSVAVSAGDQSNVTTADRATPEVPLANLFPSRDPAARRSVNSVVIPPATQPRQEAPGLQHEFHGDLTTNFTVTNRVPR